MLCDDSKHPYYGGSPPVRAVSQNWRFAGFACLPYSCPCAREADGITTTDTLGGPLMPVCARVWVLVDRDTRRHDMRVPTGSHFVIELGLWGGGSPPHLVCSWLSVVGNGW